MSLQREGAELEAGRCILCGDPSPPAEPTIAGPTVRTQASAVSGVPDNQAFGVVRCTGCGLLYTHPRPTPATIGQYYEDDYYAYQFSRAAPPSHGMKVRLWRALGMLPDHTTDRMVSAPTGRTLRHAVARWYGPRATWLLPAPHPGARFLDVGCGAGLRLELARDLGWETFGVDLGEQAVCLAGLRGHRTAVANAERLPLATASFAYVNASHVIEHLFDPIAFLRECRRVLEPAGMVQLTAPNAAGWAARRYGAHWRAWDLPRHLHHFSAETLGELVRRAGLEVAQARTLPDEWVLQESRRAAGEEVSGSRWQTYQGRRRALRGEGETLDVWCRQAIEPEGDEPCQT